MVVVGAGIVGLSAAIHLKKSKPALQVMVLERGPLPIGASTRNAGFACFGSMTELLDNLQHHSEDTVLDLVEQRWRGLQRLRRLVGDAALDYQSHGGYELFTDAETDIFKACVARMGDFNAKIGQITGQNQVYHVADERLPAFGFKGVRHLIWNQAEGQVNTGKMMAALIQRAEHCGVKIYPGMPVKNLADSAAGVSIETEMGWTIEASKVLVAVNGFAQKLLPNAAIQPARNQVLITQPIPNLAVKGCFHYDKGYYYFRNIDGRILLGGGRNLDLDTETTEEFGPNPLIRKALVELLEKVVCPNQTIAIDSWWTGILGLGPDKKPIVENISPNVTAAIRLSGMGVAIGTLVGQQGADLVLRG